MAEQQQATTKRRTKRVAPKEGRPPRRPAEKKGAARTGKPNRPDSRRAASGSRGLSSVFKRVDGCAATLIVGERIGGGEDLAESNCRIPPESSESGGRGRSLSSKMPRARCRAILSACEAFAALGHAQRARMLFKLLEGPARYRTLQQVTKLKAGPLYHHIKQMRLGGLILPKQRDLYELTRGGRNLILAAMVTGPLIRDKRRRPLPKE